MKILIIKTVLMCYDDVDAEAKPSTTTKQKNICVKTAANKNSRQIDDQI